MCPSGNSVRSEFNEAQNVFTAKLEPYEPAKINLEDKRSDIGSTMDLSLINKSLPKLIVQKVFKGNLQVGEVLEFDGVFNCNVIFAEVGGDYLLYLADKPKQGELWQAPACSRSALLENRLADIQYISKENKVRNKTRIAGRLHYDINSIIKNTKSHQMPSLANRKVYFIGEKRVFETSTNKDGVYEIYDLPVGKYKIFSEHIAEWTSKVSNYDSDIIEITKFGQYERDFKYKIFSLIGEKAFDFSELSANACLELKPVRIKQ